MIQQKLQEYNATTPIAQENALKEIAQEIALMALSRAGFFKIAAFQGGTCLRILYGLNRFSEDLDFTLINADSAFSFEPYIKSIKDEFLSYGFTLEVVNRSQLEKAVKTAFLKAESLGGLLIIKDIRSNRPKIKIKLEIDSNPPKGSGLETRFLDFPVAYSVQVQDMPSLFAGKCHALLCREYTKGRDWYDFVWYVSKKTPINITLLKNAIIQKGPWENSQLLIDPAWIYHELKIKIESTDWGKARQDVERFITPAEIASLDIWSSSFFLSRLEKLRQTIS